MMFSVGMGIGLMFWGVAEPISHFGTPPHGLAAPQSHEAALVAMKYSYFHWALHPWAIYAVTGLAIAYFSYRKGLPILISSAFTPLLGDAADGPIGKAIDTLAIIATLFGTADLARPRRAADQQRPELPLGYRRVERDRADDHRGADGAVHPLGGLGRRQGHPVPQQPQHGRGRPAAAVPRRSVGPTIFIMNTFPESLGDYLERPRHACRSAPPPSATASGSASWTIFYWAWWVSWAPFVGVFIARISRGRTIREFVIGVLLIPSAVTFIWFTIMGGAALHSELVGQGGLVEAVKEQGAAISLFALLDQYPAATLSPSSVAMFLVAIFFISGADAGLSGDGHAARRGTLDPTRPVVILWGVLAGASAAILLVMGGLHGAADRLDHRRGAVPAGHGRPMRLALARAAGRARGPRRQPRRVTAARAKRASVL